MLLQKQPNMIALLFLGLLSAFQLKSVGFNITIPNEVVPVSVEIKTTTGVLFGGVLTPGETMKVDAGIVDIERIRWMIGCDVYEVIEKIPGLAGWKDLTLKKNTCLFGLSPLNLVDNIIGWRTGNNIWHQ